MDILQSELLYQTSKEFTKICDFFIERERERKKGRKREREREGERERKERLRLLKGNRRKK